MKNIFTAFIFSAMLCTGLFAATDAPLPPTHTLVSDNAETWTGAKWFQNGIMLDTIGVYTTGGSVTVRAPLICTGLVTCANLTVTGYLYGDGSKLSNVGGGGGGANVTLSNLSPTSINVGLAPSGNGTLDVGTSVFNWRDLYLSGLATVNNLTVNGYALFAGPVSTTGLATLGSLSVTNTATIGTLVLSSPIPINSLSVSGQSTLTTLITTGTAIMNSVSVTQVATCRYANPIAAMVGDGSWPFPSDGCLRVSSLATLGSLSVTNGATLTTIIANALNMSTAGASVGIKKGSNSNTIEITNASTGAAGIMLRDLAANTNGYGQVCIYQKGKLIVFSYQDGMNGTSYLYCDVTGGTGVWTSSQTAP
jgi:hypothetical protein